MATTAIVTKLDLDRAAALGAYAARRRLDVTSCPWKTAENARTRALAFSWMNAYLHRRPPFGTVSFDD